MGATTRRPPSRCSSRERISEAAWLVKVTAVISSGRIPCCSTSHAMRSTRVLVLPVPGPAVTITTGAEAVIAASCPSFMVSSGAAWGCGLDNFFSSRFLTAFLGASAPKREICPLNCSISAGVSRVMVPYSPSKPACRFTWPRRRRRMPSATQGPAARAMSSVGTSRNMENSGPSV